MSVTTSGTIRSYLGSSAESRLGVEFVFSQSFQSGLGIGWDDKYRELNWDTASIGGLNTWVEGQGGKLGPPEGVLGMGA